MKILIIALQYPPSTETGAHRPWLLAKEFQKFGHRTTILSQNDRSDTERAGDFHLQRGASGETIVRVKPSAIPSINDGSFQCFWRMKAVIRRSRFLRGHDVVIVTGPPFFHFFLVRTLRKLGLPVILDYRDGWSEDPYPFRSLKDRLFRLLGRLAEPMLFRRASAAVFISESLRTDYRSFLHIRDDKKTFVVSNSVDIEDFNSIPARDLKTDLGLPADVRLFIYVGSLSSDIGADTFANNLNIILRKNLPDLQSRRFVFIGRSTDYSKHFDRDILDRFIIFLPPVPLRESYASIKGADVLLSLSGSHSQRLNRKIFEYAVATRPILHIGSPEGETANIVRQGKLGVIIPADDCQALERGLRSVILDAPRNVSCHGHKEHPVRFSSKYAAASYLEIIADLKSRG